MIELQWSPNGRAGNGTVAVMDGGRTVAVDAFNITKREKRAAFTKRLMSENPELDSTELDEKLLEIAAAEANPPEPEPEPVDPAKPDRLAAMPEHVKLAAREMLESPELLRRVRDDLAAVGIAGERELAMTVYLCGVSRLLSKPLAMIIQGPSSSGKSYVAEKVATLFPPETVLHATQMTPQALFHMPDGELANRFVVAGERSRRENDDTAETTRALREMLSAGRLVKLMPEKTAGGEIVTRQIEQEGPIAFVETTTMTNIFDEDANRCVLLHTDEQQEQTRRILDTLAGRYEGQGGQGGADAIVERHHALQRILTPMEVMVPFASQLARLLPADRVELRRAYPLLLTAVQASALLHQMQQQVDAEGRLVASVDDYQLVRHLLAKPMAERLGARLSDGAARFLAELDGAFGHMQFTSREARKATTASKTTANGWLSQLHEAGFIDMVEAQRGRMPAVWVVAESAADINSTSYLPTHEVLLGQK